MNISKYNINKIEHVKWAIFASIISTVYFFMIKQFTYSKNMNLLTMIIILELVVIYLYYKSLQTMHSGILYAVINGLSVILGAFIANIYFRESFTKYDIIGIVFIVSGIVIVGM